MSMNKSVSKPGMTFQVLHHEYVTVGLIVIVVACNSGQVEE